METQGSARTGARADDARDIARLARGIADRVTDPGVLADARRITRLAGDLEYEL